VVFNEKGGTQATIIMSAAQPAGGTTNWLPAPSSGSDLTFYVVSRRGGRGGGGGGGGGGGKQGPAVGCKPPSPSGLPCPICCLQILRAYGPTNTFWTPPAIVRRI
jgi:hypothetical protein